MIKTKVAHSIDLDNAQCAHCGNSPLHNVYFVKYDVTVSFLAQVLDTVTYFVSHVLVVDTVTYFDIFR